MSAAGHGDALWFLMRGSGVVSLLLLTGATTLGIATWGGIRLGGFPRFATLALHRSVSMLATAFIAIHVASAVADPYAAVGLVNVVVPFTAPSRPLLVGLGAVAADIVLALILTGILRERMSRRAWRGIRWAAYAAWPVAFVHAVGMGSDTSAVWLQTVAMTCLIVVTGTAVWRLLVRSGRTVARGGALT